MEKINLVAFLMMVIALLSALVVLNNTITRDDKAIFVADRFANMESIDIAGFHVDDNTTVKELREMYWKARQYPVFEGIVNQYVNEVCN